MPADLNMVVRNTKIANCSTVGDPFPTISVVKLSTRFMCDSGQGTPFCMFVCSIIYT